MQDALGSLPSQAAMANIHLDIVEHAPRHSAESTARNGNPQLAHQPSLISQMTCTHMQEALGFQPSQAAMAAITEASIQRAMARATWREARRRFNLALSASRCQTQPLLGGDTVAAAHIFQRLAKPAEVGTDTMGQGPLVVGIDQHCWRGC